VIREVLVKMRKTAKAEGTSQNMVGGKQAKIKGERSDELCRIVRTVVKH